MSYSGVPETHKPCITLCVSNRRRRPKDAWRSVVERVHETWGMRHVVETEQRYKTRVGQSSSLPATLVLVPICTVIAVLVSDDCSNTFFSIRAHKLLGKRKHN